MEGCKFISYSLNLKYWNFKSLRFPNFKNDFGVNKQYETRCLWMTANASLTCSSVRYPSGSLTLGRVSPRCVSYLFQGNLPALKPSAYLFLP